MSILLLTSLLLAAEPAPASDTDKARQEEVSRLAPAKAKQLQVLIGDEDSVKAELVPEPLLRWSNPTAGSVYGEVYLWTVDRRPVVIASIYRWYHPFKDSTVECVSVTDRPLEAKDESRTQWKTAQGGLRFAELAATAAPADSPRDRLRQMRSLAREFTAELTDKRSGEEVSRGLRLMEQPLHRYDCPSQSVLDGCLFTFVEGTDPEVWLIVEAVNAAGGRSWRYAMARMNIDALQVRRGESIVQKWSALRDAWSDRSRPYVMFNFRPEDVLPEAARR